MSSRSGRGFKPSAGCVLTRVRSSCRTAQRRPELLLHLSRRPGLSAFANKKEESHERHPASHFAAIAGAGPLVGPVLAAQMGYLPGMLRILAGVVFAGAVQDFMILFISTRRDGRSLGDLIKSGARRRAP